MKIKGGKFFPVFLFILFFPAIILAADIKIIEVQTEGAGGSYDECVKVSNYSSASVSITGWKLQSRSATQDRWVSRSGEGFPEINVSAGATAVLASANYSGADEIWRHISRWGLSTDGGGMRLIDSDENVITEKYWGTLENLNQTQTEPPAPAPEPQEEPEPIIEPQPEPETPPQQSDNSTIEQFNNEVPVLSPAPANAEEITIPAKEINIQISEFIPNPSGSDDGEWIEIKNLLNELSDISGWLLDDEDGGSKPYKIPKDTTIPANGFFVFYKIQTKLALNNDTDSVRILKPTGEIAEKIDYAGCAEGQSYARASDKWSWTTTPTPSLPNIITAPAPKKSATSNPPVTVYGEVTKTNEASFYILEEDGDEIKINLPAENLTVGDKVEITGTVKKTANGNQMTPKKQTDIIIKDKSPAEKENTAANPNLKYYIVLGMGLCGAGVAQGWKKREFFKGKFKKLFNKQNPAEPEKEEIKNPQSG
jgi:hypothetical protein